VERAVLLFEQALEASRRVLGDEHPDTLTTAANLDRARKEQASKTAKGSLRWLCPLSRDEWRTDCPVEVNPNRI
jgi:hypothetical protein